MATVRLSLNPSDRLQDVQQTVGLATVNKSCEITVDSAVFTGAGGVAGKEQFLLALQLFRDWALQGTWPLQ